MENEKRENPEAPEDIYQVAKEIVTRRTHLGIAVLIAALVLGCAADGLIRDSNGLGINLGLWTIFSVLLGWKLVQRTGVTFEGDGRFFVVPLLGFACICAWRSSPTLQSLDVAGLLCSAALFASYTLSGQSRLAGLWNYTGAALRSGVLSVVGAFPLLRGDIDWGTIPYKERTDNSFALMRGLLLAIPFVLMFGCLFMAADSVFNHLVISVFKWDFDSLRRHIFWIGLLSWGMAGYLRLALMKAPYELGEKTPEALQAKLGLIEVSTILGTLNILFLSFVLIQIPYLFGGQHQVHVTAGMTYAEYARSGFFELVTVASLTIPLLLFLHWILNKSTLHSASVYQILASIQVALLFVVMASALKRMHMYESSFGLTELRVYTTAFMFWLAAVLIWFIATVLRGSRNRFAFGTLISAFIAIFLLHLVNPDALIARTNIAHAAQRHKFDSCYATSLSADSVASLIDGLSKLPAQEQGIVAYRVLHDWSPPTHMDWRSWTWGKNTAWTAVQGNMVQLRELSKGITTMPCVQTDTDSDI